MHNISMFVFVQWIVVNCMSLSPGGLFADQHAFIAMTRNPVHVRNEISSRGRWFRVHSFLLAGAVFCQTQ